MFLKTVALPKIETDTNRDTGTSHDSRSCHLERGKRDLYNSNSDFGISKFQNACAPASKSIVLVCLGPAERKQKQRPRAVDMNATHSQVSLSLSLCPLADRKGELQVM